MPRKLHLRALLGVLIPAAALTAVPSEATGGYVGPPHRLVAYDPSRPCLGTGPTPATGWCSYYTGATSGRPGEPAVLATAVCRLPGLPDATLASDDGEQADFAVGVRGAPASWTWSADKAFSAAGTALAVSAGQCVEWSVRWSVTDDLGRALEPGSYYLSATPLVEPTDLPATLSAFNPQTFTVR